MIKMNMVIIKIKIVKMTMKIMIVKMIKMMTKVMMRCVLIVFKEAVVMKTAKAVAGF